MEDAKARVKSTKKRSEKAMPNQQLKEARQMRGWSQQYVADQIGADYYYLSRWERGTTSPSPYYRQKLCELFGKNAYELGFLQEKSVEEEFEGAVESGTLQPTRTEDMLYSFVLPATGEPLGRDEILASLTAQLCLEPAQRMVALYGLPGVGKTTLAAALFTQSRILDHFSDGFLWASVGTQPNPLAVFSRWGRLLGISDAEAARLTSIEAWSQTLHLAIGSRRMLIVIDDVWRSEGALVFKIAGAHCAYVFTTRFSTVAIQIAGTGAVAVPELPESVSLSLLERLVPGLVACEPQAAHNLIRSVGGLPLALTLVGKYLQVEMHSGQPRRLFTALARLHTAEERLRLSAPQALYERSPSLSRNEPITLQSILAVSDQLLPAKAQEALRALAVFPAKPDTFSEEAALEVSHTSTGTLDVLSDMGLIESVGIGRYTLHQVIADYARVHQRTQVPYYRLVAYFIQFVTVQETDYELMELESNNILAALEAAATLGLHADFITLTHASMRFWVERGLYALAMTYLEKAREFAELEQDTPTLLRTLLHLGNVALKQGKYDQASQQLQQGLVLMQGDEDWELTCDVQILLGRTALFQCQYQSADAYLQQGVLLARQHGDTQRLGAALRSLGAGANEQGQYALATTYFKESLDLVRQGQDVALLIELLSGMGQNASYQGDYAQAEAYWQEALVLARKIGYRHALSILLGNLGATGMEQGRYAQAEAYLREALANSRQMENREFACSDLGNLGALFLEQEDYSQAHRYLQEALDLTRQTKNTWLLCGVLNYWGELHLRCPDLDISVAEAAFREVYELASVGLQEYKAEALFGLGRVALLQGNVYDACKLGQESLAILDVIGNRTRTKVAQWLKTLPVQETEIE
ncbi:helix-turn-helix domain-containing protein [Ktedonobacter sp. SOSP1-85]|uniref:helix-turn-helix domain-containing protein n=1 Tax=Ktedonobacter sp. SOSP1-85 TaxID=2778367 RepID=UPI0019154A9B|nr:helix-turn-helix domain-containing protein [Ktedonobacter sp. SOSP1-85]